MTLRSNLNPHLGEALPLRWSIPLAQFPRRLPGRDLFLAVLLMVCLIWWRAPIAVLRVPYLCLLELFFILDLLASLSQRSPVSYPRLASYFLLYQRNNCFTRGFGLSPLPRQGREYGGACLELPPVRQDPSNKCLILPRAYFLLCRRRMDGVMLLLAVWWYLLQEPGLRQLGSLVEFSSAGFRALVGADVAAARLRGHSCALRSTAWIGELGYWRVDTFLCCLVETSFILAICSEKHPARGGGCLSCADAGPRTIGG